MKNLTQKEMTAHLRSRVKASGIKASGIKARVRMCPSSGTFGTYGIQIFPVSYDATFMQSESREIAFICDCNKMTMVHGDKIDLDIQEQTGGKGITVYMPQ